MVQGHQEDNYRGAREEEDPQENNGDEKAFRVNIGKREFAGLAKVRVLGEIQPMTTMQAEEPEEDKPPKMLKVSKVTTRSMAKARGLEHNPEEHVGEKASPVKEVILDQDTPKEEDERSPEGPEHGTRDSRMETLRNGPGGRAWRRNIPPASSMMPGGGTSQTLQLRTTGGMTSCER